MCAAVHTVAGFTNRSLRARVAGLLGEDYSAAKMSHDLRRLRRKQLVSRLPGTNTWALTPDGARFALFYSKVHDRVLIPLCAADHPPAPIELRRALHVVDHHIDTYVANARIREAA